MKKLIIATFLVISISAFSQEKNENHYNNQKRDHRSPEERNAMLLKRLTSELNLNANQQEQIRTVMAEQKTKREAFIKEKTANKELAKEPTKEELKERREKMQGAKKEMEEKLKTILTPEQFSKWKSIKEEAKDKMKEKRNEINRGE
jgi:periplasmic protein CpxP/Spy